MAKLVTIASFTDPLEAHIAKGRLKAEGISAFIAHEHHIRAAWFMSNALGGVKIQVLKQNQIEAEKIVKLCINGGYKEELEQEFDNIEHNPCPKCKSQKFTSRFLFGKLLFTIFVLIFSLTLPIRREKHTCKKCGYKWRY